MSNRDLFARYDRLLILMNQAEDAIGRRDLALVGSLQQQVGAMTSEIETLFQLAAQDPSARSSMADLEAPMRQALERLTLNQLRLTAWLNETGAGLGQLQQGAVAVRSYGASVRSDLPLFEQQA